jgi:hypothetical protein
MVSTSIRSAGILEVQLLLLLAACVGMDFGCDFGCLLKVRNTFACLW